MILLIWKQFYPTEEKIFTWEVLVWILVLFISFNLAKTWKNANIFFSLIFAFKDPIFLLSSFHKCIELHSVYNTVLGFEDLKKLEKQW